MKISFTKMHGLGNDFVVIDAINQDIQLNSEQIRSISDRNRGIGCDQLLLVEPPTDSSVLFAYRIFNADGHEVEQCGNGARCFARFVHDQNLTMETTIPVSTNSGNIILTLEKNNLVTVNMGVPKFTPEQIPFQTDTTDATNHHFSLSVDDRELDIGVVAIGNPHAITQVENIDTAPVTEIGPLIESHPRFPNRVNAGFMQVIDQKTIKLRVYERGVGETQACGTGACAAMVVGRRWKLLDENVQVLLTGGTLNISWKAEGEPIFMTGPTTRVFEGSIEL